MKSTVTVNASFYNKLKHLDAIAIGSVKERLEDIARTAVDYSPVDTGAYVTSFSYTIGAGRPRGKSSDNLPKGQSLEGKQEEGYGNLMQDISRIKSIEDMFLNRSVHVYAMEIQKTSDLRVGTFGLTNGGPNTLTLSIISL